MVNDVVGVLLINIINDGIVSWLVWDIVNFMIVVEWDFRLKGLFVFGYIEGLFGMLLIIGLVIDFFNG